jgi:RNA polymerase-binding transcription factor DksA
MATTKKVAKKIEAAPAKKAEPAKKAAPKTEVKASAEVEKPSVKKAASKTEPAAGHVDVAPVKSIVPDAKPSKPAAKKAAAPAKPIKVPPITAKGKVPYEPDFTHSVLDTSKDEPMLNSTPSMRYSDSDLAEFRELILRKLEAAKKELAYLQGLITRKDDMGGDNDDARYMTMEDGSLSMEREQLSQMASRQIQFIDHLEKALIRIENKTYGICRVTGKLIDKARLRAVPHATLSMEAKMGKVR